MILSLTDALRARSYLSIAFIGAGGKSTALFQLARQLPTPVIVSATSHLGVWQAELADQHIVTESSGPLNQFEQDLNGVILVTGPMDGDRTMPINETLLKWLKDFSEQHAIPLLIEADGARQKSLKAWAHHEPPIPSFIQQVVQVVGLTALGAALNETGVHRAEIFAEIGGLNMEDSITQEALSRVLIHANGGLKNIPTQARRIVLLNQAETPDLQAFAQGMVKSLQPSYDSVIISSLKQEKIFAVHERIVGVILAAGESARFGAPKQLLDWHGQPFVRAVARTALDAGLSPVILVTGANAEQVENAVKDLNVKIVKNSEWKSGQASSIKAAILSLSSGQPPTDRAGHLGAAIFLLVDQPQIPASILRALMEKHAEGLYPVVAPMVLDRRANPVLFDRTTFPDLLTLTGDVGGRAIFDRHRVEYLTWHDDGLLLDVDTPEMYQRLISSEDL